MRAHAPCHEQVILPNAKWGLHGRRGQQIAAAFALLERILSAGLRCFGHANVVRGRRMRAGRCGLRIRLDNHRVREPAQRYHRADRHPRHRIGKPARRSGLACFGTTAKKAGTRASAGLIRIDVPVGFESQQLAIRLQEADRIASGRQVMHGSRLDRFYKLCRHTNAAIHIVRTKPQFFPSRAQFMARESYLAHATSLFGGILTRISRALLPI